MQGDLNSLKTFTVLRQETGGADMVLSFYVFMYLSDPLETLKHVYGLLNENGVAITHLVPVEFILGLNNFKQMLEILSQRGYKIEYQIQSSPITGNRAGVSFMNLLIQKIPGSPDELVLPVRRTGTREVLLLESVEKFKFARDMSLLAEQLETNFI